MDILETYTKKELMKALQLSSKAMQPFLEQRRAAMLFTKTKDELNEAFKTCQTELQECSKYHNALLDYARKFISSNN